MNKSSKKKTNITGIVLVLIGLLVFFSDYIYNKFIFISKEIAINKSQVSSSDDRENMEYYDETGLVEGTNLAISEDQKVKKVESYKNVIEIKGLDIKAYVYNDLSHDSLTYGLGRYPDTPKLGEYGNTVVAGHSSNIYDCILNNLQKARILDSVDVYNENGEKFVYTITDKYIVNPDALDVLITENKNIRELTFITCTNSGSQRVIVKCKCFTDEELKLFTDNIQRTNKDKLLSINASLELFDFSSIFIERNKPVHIERNISYVDSPFNRLPTFQNINTIIKSDLAKKSHSYNKYFNTDIGFKFNIKE